MKLTIDFNSPLEALNFIIATGQNITDISSSNTFANDVLRDNISARKRIQGNPLHTTEMKKGTHPKTNVMERLKRKTYDSFVWKERLYFRIGEFFGWLSDGNDLTTITSSCFYSNRNKAKAQYEA